MWLFKNIALLIVAGALFVGSYAILTKGPCDSPISYRIGQFDPKFGISKIDFLADVAAAEKIWERPFAKSVPPKVFFKYDPKGDLPINLVYDSRQALADTNKQLSANVDQTVASADMVKAQFLSLRSSYDDAKQKYDALSADFDSALKDYNSETTYWNARGGAPADEYAKLQAQRAALEALRAQANDAMLSVNDLAHQVNALVDQYNSLVSVANSNVSKINQTANREFEEGQYISDSSGKRINVYEFDTNAKLIRLLAHELGHALGLDHNSNPQSIMYYLNSGTSLALSADDIAAVKAVCKIK